MNLRPANLFVASILLTASLTGCQSLTTQPQQQPPAQNPNMLTVQVRAANRGAKNVQIPRTQNMRLQDVVNSTKTKFRNKNAYIVRISPKTGDKHKLEAKFGDNRRISLETDYAIQPGDRVVISEDTTSSFDRVLKSMLGRT